MEPERIRIQTFIFFFLLGIIVFLIVFLLFNLSDPDKTHENVERITAGVIDKVDPNEKNGIDKTWERIKKHPYIIIILIGIIFMVVLFLDLKSYINRF